MAAENPTASVRECTMTVTVSIPVFLQAFVDNAETIQVSGQTVKECLGETMTRYPTLKKMLVDQSGKLHAYVGIYINGEDAFPDEMSRKVKDGDEIHVIYALAGG